MFNSIHYSNNEIMKTFVIFNGTWTLRKMKDFRFFSQDYLHVKVVYWLDLESRSFDYTVSGVFILTKSMRYTFANQAISEKIII